MKKEFACSIIFLLLGFPAAGQTNKWTKPSSGSWEETYWSLGQLPGIDQQLVAVDNYGWKAVAIGGNTTANYPQSLSLNNLLIDGPTNSLNTLLLNWAGFTVPLTVQSNLTIGTNGLLVSDHSALSAGETDVYGPITLSGTSANLNQVTLFSGGSLSLADSWVWCSNGLATPSAFQTVYTRNVGLTNHNGTLLIDTGDVMLVGVELEQQGGLFRVTNGTTQFINSTCSVANATWELGPVGLANGGVVNQNGGTAHLSSLGLQYVWGLEFAGQPNYSLTGGELRIDGPLSLNLGGFSQSGGTNQAQSLTLSAGCPHKGGCGGSGYSLTGGSLFDGDTTIFLSSFSQEGGTHSTTNEVSISGTDVEYGVASYGRYVLSNGVFTAGGLSLGNFSEFEQDGGVVSIANTINLNDGGFVYGAEFYSFLLRNDGMLWCNNLRSVTNGAGMLQSGGSLTVWDTLYFSGPLHWNYAYRQSYPTRYVFEDGWLSASNIEIYATWQILGSSITPYRIYNPGHFKLGGTLELNSAISPLREHLGRFILASNAIIDLPGSNSVLECDASAQESWSAGAALIITNWTGNPAGDGPERLLFGTNRFGLTQAQLSSIRFRMDTNDYPARILDSGEIVPLLPKPIIWSRAGNDLVLDWSPTNGWMLQSATNVLGPYQDIPGAPSPYTNPAGQPLQFFRLRVN
jgi:hypothetical protein